MARPRKKDERPRLLHVGRVQLLLLGKNYHARWRQNGERKSLTTRSETERGAMAFAEAINDELDRHQEFEVADVKTTVADAYAQFEEQWKDWRPSTWASARYFFSARFLPDFGSRIIGAVRQRELKVWLAQQQKIAKGAKTTSNRQEVSASAHNGFVTNLSALWRFSVDAGYCKENMLQGIGRKTEPRYMDVEADALTERQCDAVLAELKANPQSPHGYYLALLGVDTGMRRGELWALEWDDIDFEKNEIRVDDSVDGMGTKTGLVRFVPMTSRVRDALQERQRWSLGSAGHHTPVPRTDIKRALSTAGQRTGVGHIRFHMLRHTAATRWFEMANMKIEQVQRGLGHHTITQTRRYMKTRQQQLHDGIGRLDKVISKNTQ